MIKFRGIDLEVNGIHTEAVPSNDRDIPDDPEEFSAFEVLVGGVNIIELLSDDDITEIEELWLQ